ncbi:MAG: response regulator [Planctomycetes bacterium]|nr:response regulator [Planctomycetota bacterium]
MTDPARKILVVEDEELVRRLLISALRQRGHQVETCSNGEEALLKLEKIRVDVLITDFRMPRKTGMELIKALRKKGKCPPTVLMSSNTLEELAIGDADLAGVEFLRKPFGLTDLHEAIRRAVAAAKDDQQ